MQIYIKNTNLADQSWATMQGQKSLQSSNRLNLNVKAIEFMGSQELDAFSIVHQAQSQTKATPFGIENNMFPKNAFGKKLSNMFH